MTRRPAILLALVLAMYVAACVDAGIPTSSPVATNEPASAAAAGPLSPEDALARLSAVVPGMRLVPTTRPDDSGAFPDLAFDAVTTAAPARDLAPTVALVLVYPTPAARAAMQPFFGASGMSGPDSSVSIDGIAHSVWIGVDNVLVEVVMPGGTLGGRTPSPDEATYPERVREALDRP